MSLLRTASFARVAEPTAACALAPPARAAGIPRRPRPQGNSFTLADAAFAPHSNPLEFLAALSRHDADVVRYHSAPFCEVWFANSLGAVSQVLAHAGFVRAGLLQMAFGNGLLASDGPYWMRQRKLVQPAFDASQMGRWAALTAHAAGQMLDCWDEACSRGEPVNLRAQFLPLLAALLGRAMFGAELGEQVPRIVECVQTVLGFMGHVASALFNGPATIAIEAAADFRRAVADFDGMLYPLIDDCRRRPQPGDDFLSSLLQNRDPHTGRPPTDAQIRDEAITMLIGGFDNMATMLTWACYLLSEHREAAGRLETEVGLALGGRPPCHDDLSNLPFVRMVLQESLRLFPPVWQITRKARGDAWIGQHRVPEGAAVVVSPYTMQRDRRYWDEPERFRPERFAECEKYTPRQAFIPFGGGPHTCIGHRLAIVQGQVILSSIAQRFRWRMLPGQNVAPEPHLMLRPPGGFNVVLQRRDPSPAGLFPDEDFR